MEKLPRHGHRTWKPRGLGRCAAVKICRPYHLVRPQDSSHKPKKPPKLIELTDLTFFCFFLDSGPPDFSDSKVRVEDLDAPSVEVNIGPQQMKWLELMHRLGHPSKLGGPYVDIM